MKKTYFRRKNTNDTFSDIVTFNTVLSLPLSEIAPNPAQPRITFDEVETVTLADSIRQHGLLQPITVRYALPEDNTAKTYVIVAGERRFRAFQMLSREEIPCLITNLSPEKAAELAIIENIMRKDLTVFELAEAYRLLIEQYHMTQDALAKKLSTSQSNIANKLRLLRYSERERRIIEEFDLSERHARAILRLPSESARLRCLKTVADRHLSVKATEDYVDKLLLGRQKRLSHKDPTNRHDALTLLRTYLDKPLKHFHKKGIEIQSEEIEDEHSVRIILSISKESDSSSQEDPADVCFT